MVTFLFYKISVGGDVYPGSEFFRPLSKVENIPDPDPHKRI
jgi:hypothetical protein